MVQNVSVSNVSTSVGLGLGLSGLSCLGLDLSWSQFECTWSHFISTLKCLDFLFLRLLSACPRSVQPLLRWVDGLQECGVESSSLLLYCPEIEK